MATIGMRRREPMVEVRPPRAKTPSGRSKGAPPPKRRRHKTFLQSFFSSHDSSQRPWHNPRFVSVLYAVRGLF